MTKIDPWLHMASQARTSSHGHLSGYTGTPTTHSDDLNLLWPNGGIWRHRSILVNIGSGNGLLPDGILQAITWTNISLSPVRSMDISEFNFSWGQFHKKYLSHLPLKLVGRAYLYTLPEKSMEYSKSTMKTPVFDISIGWKWLGINHKPVLRFNATLTCSVMDEKRNSQCPKLEIHNRMDRNVSFLNTSPKISHSFQCILHYMVNLWDFCACSMIRYWHHVKFASGRRIKIWALKQNGRKVWLKLQYPVKNYWTHIKIP